jgi:acetylornithine aminotransferase
MTEQASKLLHTSNVYYHEWAPKLAELLVTLTQKEGGLGYAANSANEPTAKVFFANSGTEANEGALKIARKVGKDRWTAETGISWESDPSKCPKTRIACFENSFHGRSMGSISVTINAKYQNPFTPLIPGVDVGELNDLNCISKIVTKDTCAVIVEPIQGEGGINAADIEWLRALRKRCNEVGAVLIYDEIQVMFKYASEYQFVLIDGIVRYIPNGHHVGSLKIPHRMPSRHSDYGQAAG